MVRIDNSVATRVVDLMLLFSKKAAFQLPEYESVGGVFTRLSKAIEDKNDPVNVDVVDVKLMIGTINVCSQRTPVEVQNYRVIADLLDTLTATLKEEEEEEETKTEL